MAMLSPWPVWKTSRMPELTRRAAPRHPEARRTSWRQWSVVTGVQRLLRLLTATSLLRWRRTPTRVEYSSPELQERERTWEYRVLAFYVVRPVKRPEAEAKEHKRWCRSHGLVGRVWVSHTGINVQVSGKAADCEKYADFVAARFGAKGAPMVCKLDPVREPAFPHLRVKAKKLVSLSDELQGLDMTDRGKDLEPKEWLQRLQGLDDGQPGKVLDIRNNYEWELGHFGPAKRPNTEELREMTPESLGLEEEDKETPLYMYCTGGIRCEFFGAALRRRGFRHVYKLKGGVQHYGNTVGAENWKGRLFVFDHRNSVPVGAEGQSEMQSCSLCGGGTAEAAWKDAWDYSSMSLAMLFGSVIAGSMPLGGGVVAFPVAVLFIHFQAGEGRDFALLIQSVGMSAASFAILYTKSYLCHTWLIFCCVFFGVLGMLLGFEKPLQSRGVAIGFTTTVSCFAVAFFYSKVLSGRKSENVPHINVSPWEFLEHQQFQHGRGWQYFGRHVPWVLTFLVAIFGVVGGYLSSNHGSGADMCSYIFGVFIWNYLAPESAQMSETMLTASSVVIMAVCSLVGSLVRALTGDISNQVLLCWAACAPIVVIGAPLGSLFLTSRMALILRRCFFVFVLVMFVSMGIWSLSDDLASWLAVAAALAMTIFCLATHFACFVQGPQKVDLPQV
ncbi:unnamed protein product [Effrenium voratum]|uniref:Rhodanese domain-containing protein n=1 Tax=Effrenium voratum TaxID=2562239 RepID=A0AA36NCS1_9DINO|nr:unnamed protein product [Effrenium voratum]